MSRAKQPATFNIYTVNITAVYQVVDKATPLFSR